MSMIVLRRRHLNTDGLRRWDLHPSLKYHDVDGWHFIMYYPRFREMLLLAIKENSKEESCPANPPRS